MQQTLPFWAAIPAGAIGFAAGYFVLTVVFGTWVAEDLQFMRRLATFAPGVVGGPVDAFVNRAGAPPIGDSQEEETP